jgi:hypothetical protein
MKPFGSLPRCFQRRKQSDFVCKGVNEQSKIWDGDFLTKEEVSTISGVKCGSGRMRWRKPTALPLKPTLLFGT